ncbi:hypothetical protein V2J09_022916 [Rumex salicifolius]
MYPPPEKASYSQPPPPGPHVAQGIPMGGPQPVVIQAPPAQQRPGYWSSGLCDCFSDVRSCCLVCWCPCVAFGQLSEVVDKGTSCKYKLKLEPLTCCCNGSLYLCLCSVGAMAMVFGLPLSCQWIYSCTYRAKIKQDLGMPPSCCEECCLHFWCEPCSLCQEYRQIQSQGYDLSLGWNGNQEKMRMERGNGMPVTPPVAPNMALSINIIIPKNVSTSGETKLCAVSTTRTGPTRGSRHPGSKSDDEQPASSRDPSPSGPSAARWLLVHWLVAWFSGVRVWPLDACCCNGSLYLGLCAMGALAVVFGVPLSCQWIYSCTYRGKIKQDLGMPPSCCEECCLHFWCEPCSLCQEYRQIQNQGYDLSLGWHGNQEKMRMERENGMPVTPPVAPSMAR